MTSFPVMPIASFIAKGANPGSVVLSYHVSGVCFHLQQFLHLSVFLVLVLPKRTGWVFCGVLHNSGMSNIAS